MASNLSIPMLQVEEFIQARRASGWTEDGATVQFVNRDFELHKTYYPDRSLQDIPADGIVWVVGLHPDKSNKSRRHERVWNITLQVVYQIKVKKPQDFDELDVHVQMHEQLVQAAEDSCLQNDLFTWNGSVGLKDENGLPFNYAGLREAQTFEAFANINLIATQKGVSS